MVPVAATTARPNSYGRNSPAVFECSLVPVDPIQFLLNKFTVTWSGLILMLVWVKICTYDTVVSNAEQSFFQINRLPD